MSEVALFGKLFVYVKGKESCKKRVCRDMEKKNFLRVSIYIISCQLRYLNPDLKLLIQPCVFMFFCNESSIFFFNDVFIQPLYITRRENKHFKHKFKM